MEEATSSKTVSLTPISKAFLLYVNIGFYSLLVPFRLKYDPHMDTIVAVRSRGLHKILSLVVCFLGQVMLVNSITEPYKLGIDQTAWTLNILGNLGWWLVTLVMTVELWRKSEQFAAMANNMMAMERETLKLGIGVHWAFKYSAIVPIFLHLHMLAMNLWEMERHRLRFWQSPFTFLNVFEVAPGGSAASIVLNNIGFTVFEHYSQITQFGLKIIFFLSLKFFVMASSFGRHAESCISEKEVFKICVLLSRLSYSGRRSFGFGILARVLLLLPYFALRVQDVFGESLALQLQYCYFIGTLVADLGFAAEAHAQVNSFAKALVTESVDNGFCKSKSFGDVAVCPWLDFRTKTLLLNVLNGEGIGVKGRGLTITYFFFGSLMASILAYSIAILQLQSLNS